MKEMNPERFKKAAKELERRAAVVREAMAIIETIPQKRAKRRKTRKAKVTAKSK